jgi:hypothetical protein
MVAAPLCRSGPSDDTPDGAPGRRRTPAAGKRGACPMSQPATALSAITTLDDDAWEDLLSFIEERRVIPIVGPELLMVATERGPRLLFDWAAEKLAARLNVNTAELPHPYTLNDVACVFLAQRGRREEAYVRLRGIVKDANFAPPETLRHLAAITDFDLFVSTTADSLLEASINLERFSGAPGTEVLSYSPNRVVDLPSERDRLARPVVYHLFGKLASSPTYVISDEDLLEFICALQSEHLLPEKLFHELEHNHLLFIGSNFTNWLARLFLRMAKRQRLSDPRDVGALASTSARSASSRSCTGAGRRGASPAPPQRGRRRRVSCHPRARCRTTPSSSATPVRTCPRCSRSKRGWMRPVSLPGSTSTGSRRAMITTARSATTLRAARTSFPWSRRRPSGGSKGTSGASGATRWTGRAIWQTARCSSCR